MRPVELVCPLTCVVPLADPPNEGNTVNLRVAELASELRKQTPVRGWGRWAKRDLNVNLRRPDNDLDAAPWVSLLDDETKIVASRLGEDRFRVAGTAEINGYSRDIRQARIDPLLKWCEELFPDMCTRSYVPWAGLRPMMPNMMPVVRAGRSKGVFYNTGHGHLGWTLSAATSTLVADLVEQRLAA